MENTFGKRLASARKMAGMSLQTLADTMGNVVTKQSLSKYEQGEMKPDSAFLVKLANVLNVTIDYFFDEPLVQIEFSNPDYRKHASKVSNKEKAAIEEKSKHLLEKYFEIENLVQLDEEEEYFAYKDVIRTPDEAEMAAKQLRFEWRLGYDPIPDVVAMLEDKGYKVLEIEASQSFDGMAVEVGDRQVIVLNH